MKTYFKTEEFSTDQNNLMTLEPKLVSQVQDYDYFYVIDFTEKCGEWVNASGIQNGFLTLQALHTTCVIGINELDEPCLLGDINNALRESYPRTKKYLHNGPLRTKNLCEGDHKCDRNADAHLKAFLFGSPTQTVLIREGKPVFGQWQRLCLIDFDGPRTRKVAIQVIGE